MWQLILPSKDKLSGLRWSQMELDGPSWSEMVPNGLRNEMVPDRKNGLKWSKVVEDGDQIF